MNCVLVVLILNLFCFASSLDEVLNHGTDQCSSPIDLHFSLDFRDFSFKTIYACSNGYITLGRAPPDILKTSDDFMNVKKSNVIAPLLLQERNYVISFEDGLKLNTQSRNDYLVSAILKYRDSKFNPTYYFKVKFSNEDDTEFRVLIIEDENYYGKMDPKKLVVFHYSSLSVSINDKAAAGDIARAGTNSPNKNFYMELDGSGTVDVRNVLFSGKGAGGQEQGVWTFEVDKSGSGVILKPMTNSTTPDSSDSKGQFFGGASQNSGSVTTSTLASGSVNSKVDTASNISHISKLRSGLLINDEETSSSKEEQKVPIFNVFYIIVAIVVVLFLLALCYTCCVPSGKSKDYVQMAK